MKKLNAFIFSVVLFAATALSLKFFNDSQNAYRWPAEPDSYVEDPESMETQHRLLTQSVKTGLLAPLKKLNFSTIRAFLHPEFQGFVPKLSQYTSVDVTGNYEVMELTKVEESELRVSAEEFVAILSNMLATATRVERANWHAFTSLSSDEATVPHHFVQAHVEIGFRGAAQSRTSFIWEVEAEFREHQSELKLAKLAVSKGHSVHSPEPPFVDISSESGFNGLKDRGFVGNSTSSSLSVFDYNKDGYWDIATSFDNQISDLT